ncbi:DUF4364 family protein [Butyrivibrio sp. FCS014]|uniref:DUF4364 family protein n=1 Tax=Butyrivibrio sp. FCS014 TaxID=1408304 RepID=UPI000465CC84|nr:DUF4364 family protein [Butyrivibrio sp. FCS014]
MSSTYLTLYKMIVLYMLKRCQMPLSKSQIYDFILEKEYTNFLTLQEVFSELASSGLITEKTMANRTYLELTEDGAKTLEFFGNRVNPAVRDQIDEYLKANNMKLINETSIKGDYRKVADNDYEVRMIATDGNQVLMDLTMSVPTEETAQSILDKWQNRNQEIYSYLVKELM